MDPHKDKISLLRNRNLYIIFGITLVAIQGVSSITPALPRMSETFALTPQQIGWLITIFTLPGVFLTPVLGVVADRFGRKRILVPALFLFALGGLACALSKTWNTLLFFRFIQGMGAASLGSLNVTLLGDLFSGKERTRAMGYNASVLSVGTATYPLIGGALALLGWNYPFFLAFLGFPIGIVILYALNNPEPQDHVALAEYLLQTWKRVKSFPVLTLFLSSAMTFILLYGAFLTFFPILLAKKFSLNSFYIGLVFSSMSLSTALTSSQVGRLLERFDEKKLFRISFFIYAIALCLIPLINSPFLMVGPTIIFGVAQGLNIPNQQSLLASFAPLQHRGAVLSINGMVLRLGQTLGPLLMGGIFTLWYLPGVYYVSALLAILLFVYLSFALTKFS
ncbi:MFS transporter [candidate division KSB1 bacterium]|nr:MFS transporter [candidate division KSB1 bacterium]